MIFLFIFLIPFLVLGQSKDDKELLSLKNVQSCFKSNDDWLGGDKAKHLLASMLLTGAITYYYQHHQEQSYENSAMLGIGLTFSLGIAKEIRDGQEPNRTFSWKDMTANIIGIVLGVVFLSRW
jgi:uncharacterized protein YfiM (DUF2279 family)